MSILSICEPMGVGDLELLPRAMHGGRKDRRREGGKEEEGEEGKQGALPYLFLKQLHFIRQLALLETISYVSSWREDDKQKKEQGRMPFGQRSPQHDLALRQRREPFPILVASRSL